MEYTATRLTNSTKFTITDSGAAGSTCLSSSSTIDQKYPAKLVADDTCDLVCDFICNLMADAILCPTRNHDRLHISHEIAHQIARVISTLVKLGHHISVTISAISCKARKIGALQLAPSRTLLGFYQHEPTN
jgi:hypothetical protein